MKETIQIHGIIGDNLGLYYKDHRAIDDKHGIILATQATSGDVTDEQQFKPLMDDVIFKKQVLPSAVAADKKYGHVENYKDLIDKGIEPNIPHVDPPSKKGMFSKNEFSYDPAKDTYTCPAGETLLPQSAPETTRRLFRASGPVCAACELRSRCATGKGPRTIYRHSDESYVDQALEKRDAPRFKQNMGRRMAVAEGSFGHSKDHHAHRRACWRGPEKMQIQSDLVATVQDLLKLLKYGWKTSNNGVSQAINAVFHLFRGFLHFLLAFLGTTRPSKHSKQSFAQFLNFKEQSVS